MKNNDLPPAENYENTSAKGETVFERIIQSRAVLSLIVRTANYGDVTGAILAVDALLEDAQRITHELNAAG